MGQNQENEGDQNSFYHAFLCQIMVYSESVCMYLNSKMGVLPTVTRLGASWWFYDGESMGLYEVKKTFHQIGANTTSGLVIMHCIVN